MNDAVWVLLTIAALSACDKSQETTPAPAASPPKALPAAPSAPPPSASVAASAAPSAKPALPAVPLERSKPPTKPEWDAAEKVNTAPKEDQSKQCWMKSVREWVRLECLGHESAHLIYTEELGSKGSDWLNPDAGAFILIFRMRPGHDIRAKLGITSRRQGPFLRVSWPEGSDRPSELSLSDVNGFACVPGIEVMPKVPRERSKVPTLPEWRDAREVNTSSKDELRTECRIRVVREWAKLSCGIPGMDVPEPEAFGQKSSDWFLSAGDSLDFVFRLKPGLDVSRQLPNGTKFRVQWPAEEPRPKTLSVGYVQE